MHVLVGPPKVCFCRCTLLSTRLSIENIESGFFPSTQLVVEIGDYNEIPLFFVQRQGGNVLTMKLLQGQMFIKALLETTNYLKFDRKVPRPLASFE